jgi:hypothetical protein
MTDAPIASYTFLPFARQGLGGKIATTDGPGVPGIRATIAVNLTLSARMIDGTTKEEPVPRNVQLYGPGDVIGVDQAAIVRSEPRHGITNFETNFLPFVEFYDEDFPWRYTPSGAFASGRRLRPWLALVVAAEGEWRVPPVAPNGPLPVIEMLDPAGLPAFDTLWAWAHVHVNGVLGGTQTDAANNAQRLAAVVAADRDDACSRVLSPRRLERNTAYEAFLVPSFESGRLAGLGLDPSRATHPTQSAWDGAHDPDLFPALHPVYHRWSFRTGEVGDFEYLVRLLEPRTVDPRVGRRDIDTQAPGAGLPPITNLGGVLRLGGALRAPLETLDDDEVAEYKAFENWPVPRPAPFQTAMASLVNLATDYGAQTPADANADTGIADVAGSDVPLVVPPLYGRWHALVSRLDASRADPDLRHWVDELNLDPRHRVSAGLGTSVVQKNQEDYMEAAWLQVGKVLEGNSRIRFAHMALLTSLVWHRDRLAPFAEANDDLLLRLTAPVHRRVLSAGTAVGFAMRHSMVPPALVGTSVRKLLRPRSRIVERGGFTTERPAAAIVDRVNSGEVSAAPPKRVPENLPTGSALGEAAESSVGLPPWLRWILKAVPWWRVLLLGFAFVAALLCLLIPVVGIALAIAVVATAVARVRWLDRKLAHRPGAASGILDQETRTPESVADLPQSGSFEIVAAAADGEPVPPPPRRGPDSKTARRFKDALRNTYAVDAVERTIPRVQRSALDVRRIRKAVFAGIDPTTTIPRRVRTVVDVPERIVDGLVEEFGEVMVYPRIDDPMYEPLLKLSDEYFLPALQLLQMNSITLLETNQKFIEAYMVGLNHEFARELLWREYPTDQRGSVFRQFWDASAFLSQPGGSAESTRERLYDIPELHRWSTENEGLGDHDNRELQGDKENELVLTLRGELLKKYPTAVIYAHRAQWQRRAGVIDNSKPRVLADLPVGTPPTSLVKTPLYEAKVPPDITFLGFDLVAKDAKGGELVGGEEDPGWFFVIKERPGDARFGLDLPDGVPSATVTTWNELSWTDVLATPAAQLPVGTPGVSIGDTSATGDAKKQHDEDAAYRWQSDTDAAEVAYILYQLPVLMAVHASEMLEKDGE